MHEKDQRYAEYRDRWRPRFGAALANRGHDPDTVWDPGVLDLVSPLDVAVRDALAKAGTGLPWGSRSETQLYWRIMYAAYAEAQVVGDPRVFSGAGIRPIRDVAEMYPERYRSEILRDIVGYAGHQLRLRLGLPQRPEPLASFSEVRIGGHAAHIDGYGFDGVVFASRETRPEDPQGIAWELDTRYGRWRAGVLPWQFQANPVR